MPFSWRRKYFSRCRNPNKTQFKPGWGWIWAIFNKSPPCLTTLLCFFFFPCFPPPSPLFFFFFFPPLETKRFGIFPQETDPQERGVPDAAEDGLAGGPRPGHAGQRHQRTCPSVCKGSWKHLGCSNSTLAGFLSHRIIPRISLVAPANARKIQECCKFRQ